jgi:methyl-accepting chemotaxis protein
MGEESMPENAAFNQKEMKEFEDINKNLKVISKTLKEHTQAMEKMNSKTNQNTLMFRLVAAVEDLTSEVKKFRTEKDKK